MEVPAERKSVNKASISFQLVNDLGYDVKVKRQRCGPCLILPLCC